MADVLGLFIFFLQGESLGVPKSYWKSVYSYIVLKLLLKFVAVLGAPEKDLV